MRDQSPSLDEAAFAELRGWIGREEVVEDRIAALPAAAISGLFDHEAARPGDGAEVPPLGHWLYLQPIHRQSELAEDGHPQRGGFMPPVPLPRRMFAGARVAFHRPLRVGERARRVGRVEGMTLKQGRTGPLLFVSVRQELSAGGEVALVEEQDIVYRTLPSADEAPAPRQEPPQGPDWSRPLLPDARMLFQYSALLYSAHRIHFDGDYTMGQEGYPGLVVQGQLTATALADLARRETGRRLAAFSFKARRALFADRPVTLAGRQEGERVQLWASDDEGALAMQAEATLAAD